MAKTKPLEIYSGRVTEDYILNQVNYNLQSDAYRDWKNRMEDGDSLYLGELNKLFPNESALPDWPLVENKFKNALHDIARLASEGRGAVKFVAPGERNKDMKGAQVCESVCEGYWVVNHLREREGKLYLDMAGSSMMALAHYFDDSSPYPQIRRLDPRFCWPTTDDDGRLVDMLYAREVRERVAAAMFPNLELDPLSSNTVLIAAYYNRDEVAEAVVRREKDKATSADVTQRWQHDLNRVPVAFESLDSYDGKYHGLFEQLKGPMMVRNKIVRFLVDYMEQMAHAPIFEMGVENWDAEPGPLTVYHGDPNSDKTTMQRVPPAAPAGAVWGLIQYMDDQEQKEAIQPPARSGNVSQSIASGSFVDRTQGQLTSLIKECQDKMASLRRQSNEICMAIDEKHMDFSKPLVRPVAGKREYTPTEDIGGWYIHEVKFGAGAGLDRINTQTRVLNDLAARLISREEARAEIDYIDDSASSQDKIDRESLADAIMQRMVRDPAIPLSVIAQTFLDMEDKGDSLTEALKKSAPQLIAAEQAQQQAVPGGPAAPQGAPPEEVPGGLPGGAPQQPGGAASQVQLQQPPLAQLLVR